MKRIVYCPAGRRLWFDLAVRLRDEGVATPVAWLGDPRHEARAREAFPDCDVLPFMPIRAGTLSAAPLWRGGHAGFFQSAEHDAARDQAIKLMDRVDWFGAHRNVTREALFDGLVLWALALVERHDPDALLLSEAPHAPLQLVLHHLFRWLDREVLCFSAWSVAPILSLRRGHDGGRVDAAGVADWVRGKLQDEVAGIVESFASDLPEPRYMAEQRAKAARIARRASMARAALAPFRQAARPITGPLSRRYAVDPDPAIVSGNLFSEDRLPRNAAGRFRRTVAARRARLIDRLAQAVSRDLPARFVYFPLHYEPERTTNPDGGRFHDQIRALSVLRSLLPPDLGIVVKEHPSQLSAAMRGYLGRSPGAYRVMRQISGLTVAPMDLPSAELIQRAEAVAVITGTAALEAACLGRPALIFGHPWFEGCPNTLKVAAGSEVTRFLAAPRTARGEVAAWLQAELQRSGLPGCINPSNERYFSGHYDESGSFAAAELDAVAATLRSALG